MVEELKLNDGLEVKDLIETLRQQIENMDFTQGDLRAMKIEVKFVDDNDLLVTNGLSHADFDEDNYEQ